MYSYTTNINDFSGKCNKQLVLFGHIVRHSNHIGFRNNNRVIYQTKITLLIIYTGLRDWIAYKISVL